MRGVIIASPLYIAVTLSDQVTFVITTGSYKSLARGASPNMTLDKCNFTGIQVAMKGIQEGQQNCSPIPAPASNPFKLFQSRTQHKAALGLGASTLVEESPGLWEHGKEGRKEVGGCLPCSTTTRKDVATGTQAWTVAVRMPDSLWKPHTSQGHCRQEARQVLTESPTC